MNGVMKLEETGTLYDLLENAGRLYGKKIFLKYGIDDEVYEKTYQEIVNRHNEALPTYSRIGHVTA